MSVAIKVSENATADTDGGEGAATLAQAKTMREVTAPVAFRPRVLDHLTKLARIETGTSYFEDLFEPNTELETREAWHVALVGALSGLVVPGETITVARAVEAAEHALAAHSVFKEDEFVSGSPGYVGPVWIILWDGAPGFHTSVTQTEEGYSPETSANYAT